MKILLIYPSLSGSENPRRRSECSANGPLLCGRVAEGTRLPCGNIKLGSFGSYIWGRGPGNSRKKTRISSDCQFFRPIDGVRWKSQKRQNPLILKSLWLSVVSRPTFLWKHFLTHFEDIDFCVLGEGEYPFLELVKAIETGNRKKIKFIKGIAYRSNGRPIKTGRSLPIKNLDSLPIPSKYFDYQHVAFTRGCPAQCTFCGSPKFWGRRVRFHSATYFVKQLMYLYERGPSIFLFLR